MKITRQELEQKDLMFTNSLDDLIEVSLLNGRFLVWLNGVIVKSTKGLKPAQQKLDFLLTI
tara:strand:- start:23 stop:205 length:183 start_codon:yes stop_codon:yes gene_type:complete